MPLDPFLAQSQDHGGSEMPSLKAGQVLFNRRYELKQPLGAGGMGMVWLARDHTELIDVALKFLPSVLVLQDREMQRLRDEVRAGKELRHPRLVATYGMEMENGIAAIVMEYVQGQTLRQRLDDHPRGFFEPEDIRGWVKDMTDGLTYLHEEAKRIHRDLKPANVMVDANGRAKLMDFGISHRIKEGLSRHSKTSDGEASSSSSTLAYASPQQITGKPASTADDLYSLGATVYELLTGTPPFFRGGMDAVRGQIKDEPATPIMERRQELVQEGLNRSTGESVRGGIAQAVMACLAKDRDKRLTTPAELWHSFDNKTARPATPETDSEPRKKTPRPRDTTGTASRSKTTEPRHADNDDTAKRAAEARKQAAKEEEARKKADLDRVVKRAEERWGATNTKKEVFPPSPILTPPTVKPPDAAPSPPQEPKKFEDKINYLGCCFWMGVAASIASAVEQLVRGTTPFSWDSCLGVGFGTAIVLGPCVIMPVYVFIRALFDKS
ncbi:MAG: protein kinase [Verrucomicrobiaceae bacterium]|nr:protein kinase [Verrucomicrobiaceae bacterium]